MFGKRNPEEQFIWDVDREIRHLYDRMMRRGPGGNHVTAAIIFAVAGLLQEQLGHERAKQVMISCLEKAFDEDTRIFGSDKSEK